MTIINSVCYSSGGGQSGKYKLLDRVKDDNNNEIGTVSGFFTDANDVEYAVVCLDAQYREASKVYCSKGALITDLPRYEDCISAYWWSATDTATFNTQKILDYCTANGYTSSACTGCRSHYFTIDGTTYYGQLPNMREVFDISQNFVTLNSKDPSASGNPTKNFASAKNLWSSTQVDTTSEWYFNNTGYIYPNTKTWTNLACPVLEIPNQ